MSEDFKPANSGLHKNSEVGDIAAAPDTDESNSRDVASEPNDEQGSEHEVRESPDVHTQEEEEEENSTDCWDRSSDGGEICEVEEVSEVEPLAELMKTSLECVRNSEFYRRLVQQMESLGIIDRLCSEISQIPVEGNRPQAPQESSSSLDKENPHRMIDQTLTNESIQPATDCSEPVGIESDHRCVVLPIGRPRIELVCYGIGRIACLEIYRALVALAILVKEHFQSEIIQAVVCDPHRFEPFERDVLATYGFGVVVCNSEYECLRRATVPTLFYMPNNDVIMSERLLYSNLTARYLMCMVILGHSFMAYSKEHTDDSEGHLCLSELQRLNVVEEYAVDEAGSPFKSCFKSLSWHFFSFRQNDSLRNAIQPLLSR
ncbi:hypothetical protein O6H91_13G003800 [Diphasiastrum complanatum]|uniref:Uncharacterized protein n=2 Tax=Diphasiastrum complanatum TaxID=34168 RepID=A0ACC2BSF8_DIPCM|nr:hypothetical protein O6H91_13G003800 [Diphasiastrum complanatum]